MALQSAKRAFLPAVFIVGGIVAILNALLVLRGTQEWLGLSQEKWFAIGWIVFVAIVFAMVWRLEIKSKAVSPTIDFKPGSAIESAVVERWQKSERETEQLRERVNKLETAGRSTVTKLNEVVERLRAMAQKKPTSPGPKPPPTGGSS